MTQQTQAVTTQTRPERETLDAILQRPGYVKRFAEVLRDRAPQFMSSILAVGRTMPDVEPKSIVASAMIAATLDLPIEKGLGFAWIVPYRDGERKYAQFQLGWKGLVQLAQRSGMYQRMNAAPINAEALNGFDEVGEPRLDWTKMDLSKEAVGYMFAFRLTNGFTKVAYWSKTRVQSHAQRYSQSYRKGQGPWKTNFDEMAMKTVVKNELSDWGILSVQWQLARRADQAIIKDIDAEPEYIDIEAAQHETVEERKAEPTNFQQATQAPPAPPAPPTPAVTVPKRDRVKRQAATKPQDAPGGVQTPPESTNVTGQPAAQQAPPPNTTPAPPTPPAKEAPPAAPTTPAPTPAKPPFKPHASESEALTSVRLLLYQVDRTEEELMAVMRTNRAAKDNQKLADLSESKLLNISKAWPSLYKQIQELQSGNQAAQ